MNYTLLHVASMEAHDSESYYSDSVSSISTQCLLEHNIYLRHSDSGLNQCLEQLTEGSSQDPQCYS